MLPDVQCLKNAVTSLCVCVYFLKLSQVFFLVLSSGPYLFEHEDLF